MTRLKKSQTIVEFSKNDKNCTFVDEENKENGHKEWPP
jgi:hypothetical protein